MTFRAVSCSLSGPRHWILLRPHSQRLSIRSCALTAPHRHHRDKMLSWLSNKTLASESYCSPFAVVLLGTSIESVNLQFSGPKLSLIHARLNLTEANHVFLMEPQWNPMVEDQAFARVYRLGQTKPVTTVRYIVKGTLEEVSITLNPVCERLRRDH